MLVRRWRQPQVAAGRSYQTADGLIAVEEIAVVDAAELTEVDAARAGYRTAAELRADLRGRPGDPVHLLRVRPVDGPDPRAELAATTDLTDADVAELDRRLDRLDRASRLGPWTQSVLTAIRAEPGLRAADLAGAAGREMLPYKTDVRKLKALGLTVSRPVGYQLSPRGEAYFWGSKRGLTGTHPGRPERLT